MESKKNHKQIRKQFCILLVSCFIAFCYVSVFAQTDQSLMKVLAAELSVVNAGSAWGESDRWPKKGWNYSFFNHAMEPFPQAWLTKSIFKDEPLVHIGVVDNEGESKTKIIWQ